eukprot:Hpha_TRINITY_DN20156_c0_g1::TRINITY_DN20156_c0_g1_i1::g.82600::m.82600
MLQGSGRVLGRKVKDVSPLQRGLAIAPTKIQTPLAPVPKRTIVPQRGRPWEAPTLPPEFNKWPDPRTAHRELVSYVDPCPDAHLSQRPSIWGAVHSGNANEVAAALHWEWVEEAGDGLATRWDPSSSFSQGAINEWKEEEVWVSTRGDGEALIPEEFESPLAAARLQRECIATTRTATPIGLAVLRGRADVAKVLLRHPRCDPNRRVHYAAWDPQSRKPGVSVTALFVAVVRGDEDCIKALLDHPRTDGHQGAEGEGGRVT